MAEGACAGWVSLLPRWAPPGDSALQRPLGTDLHLGLGWGLRWSCKYVTDSLGVCGETLSPFGASVAQPVKGKLVLTDFHDNLQGSSPKRC